MNNMVPDNRYDFRDCISTLVEQIDDLVNNPRVCLADKKALKFRREVMEVLKLRIEMYLCGEKWEDPNVYYDVY